VSAMVLIALESKEKNPAVVDRLIGVISGLQERALAAGAISATIMQDMNDPCHVYDMEEWPSSDEQRAFTYGLAAHIDGVFSELDELCAEFPRTTYLRVVKESRRQTSRTAGVSPRKTER
jgi:hypothetical protein